MKTTFLALLLLSIVFGGCLEYETKTTIHPDGSFTRTVVVKGDSGDVHRGAFRVPADLAWSSSPPERVDEKKWRSTLTRTFSSSDEWRAFHDSVSRRTLRCDVRVERSFLFFTTTYVYTEVVRRFNPFQRVPLTDFLSDHELDLFLRFEVRKESAPSEQDSLLHEDAGRRFERWEGETRFASYFEALIAGLPPSSPLRSDTSRLERARQKLHGLYVEDLSDQNKVFRRPDEERLRGWVRQAGEPDLLRALVNNGDRFAQLKEDVDFVRMVFEDSFITRVSLPGEVVWTNSSKTEEDQPTWSEYIAYAYVGDYTMRAESRVVNVWAIVLALAVIVAVPMLALVAKGLRRRGISSVQV